MKNLTVYLTALTLMSLHNPGMFNQCSNENFKLPESNIYKYKPKPLSKKQKRKLGIK
jgi:hypothetical protein